MVLACGPNGGIRSGAHGIWRHGPFITNRIGANFRGDGWGVFRTAEDHRLHSDCRRTGVDGRSVFHARRPFRILSAFRLDHRRRFWRAVGVPFLSVSCTMSASAAGFPALLVAVNQKTAFIIPENPTGFPAIPGATAFTIPSGKTPFPS